ncbi:MAG: oligosaccharide flippase family protein [Anaerolineales bacterium]|nr:oligosaccharide flippase family protein [Anaerolineales bacterium]
MVFNLAGWGLPIAVNVIAVPILLHLLGPDAYGLSNLVLVVVGYFSIMDMGTDIAAVKLLAEYDAKKDADSINRLMSTNLQFYLCVGIVGMLLLLLSADILATRVFSVPEVFRAEAATVFRLGALGLLANMLVVWATAVPQGLQRYDIMNGLSTATSLVGTGAGVAVVYAGYGVVGFVFIRVLVTAMAGVGGVVVARYLIPTLKLRFGFDREMLRRIWGISAYGVVIKTVGIICGSVDRTLVGIWLGTTAVAFYAVPYMVATCLNQIMLRMMNFMFPMASEMLHKGRLAEFRVIFLRASKFTMAISTMVILPVVVLADRFLTLWVGAELAIASSNTFRLLLIGTYLGSMVALFSYILIGIGYIKQFTWFYVFKTCFLVGVCLVLIRPLGILGAGIAILASSMLDVLIGAFCLPLYIGIPTTRFFAAYIRPVGLGIALSILVVVVRPYISSWVTLVSAVFSYALLYLIIGFYIGVFGQTEKEVFLRMWQKFLSIGKRSSMIK